MTSLIRSASRAPGFRALSLFSVRPVALLREAVALSRQRRQLAALDATRLDDLGLTAQDARREAARPFWDAPQHWKA
ncbi:MAG: DUF1127 domain-containing protein [Rhodobacter sp.]|nr:DUF1127 domain-containing protein [Paracoccaceae bacterium]MCC0076423.1 DUF1127 domain-containing protein [Rhodobacter sp.]